MVRLSTDSIRIDWVTAVEVIRLALLYAVNREN